MKVNQILTEETETEYPEVKLASDDNETQLRRELRALDKIEVRLGEIREMEKYQRKAYESNFANSEKAIKLARDFAPLVLKFNKLKKPMDKAFKEQDWKTLDVYRNKLGEIISEGRVNYALGDVKTLLKRKRMKVVTPVLHSLYNRMERIIATRDQLAKIIKHANLSDKQREAAAKASARMKMRWYE